LSSSHLAADEILDKWPNDASGSFASKGVEHAAGAAVTERADALSTKKQYESKKVRQIAHTVWSASSSSSSPSVARSSKTAASWINVRTDSVEMLRLRRGPVGPGRILGPPASCAEFRTSRAVQSTRTFDRVSTTQEMNSKAATRQPEEEEGEEKEKTE
jgi:hypothetical protein